jgi:hypothetical protein
MGRWRSFAERVPRIESHGGAAEWCARVHAERDDRNRKVSVADAFGASTMGCDPLLRDASEGVVADVRGLRRRKRCTMDGGECYCVAVTAAVMFRLARLLPDHASTGVREVRGCTQMIAEARTD